MPDGEISEDSPDTDCVLALSLETFHQYGEATYVSDQLVTKASAINHSRLERFRVTQGRVQSKWAVPQGRQPHRTHQSEPDDRLAASPTASSAR